MFTGADPPAFVGRVRELVAVRSVVDRAQGGAAGALLLTGDAGVGKSTLVQRVTAACGPDTVVLSGGGLPMASVTVPYLALRSAFRRLPEGVSLPACLRRGGGSGQVLEEIDAWIDDVTSRSTVVLVVDDLHWTDQSTLDVLLYLLAGPRDRRLAILATVRRGEVAPGARLNTWLADVRRLPGFEVLDVGPLTRLETADQVAGLFGTPAHETLVDEVFARTRGNCYLTRLLVAGVASTSGHLPTKLPDDIEEAVLATWHRLSRKGREVTTVLAIGGHRQSATELTKVTRGRFDVEELATLLGVAASAGVLDLDEVDGRFWFHHPLQAEVLVKHVPVDERRRWHEAFAAHFEAGLDDTGDVGVLALIADHHFHAGHEEEAYHWSLRAAEPGPGVSAAGGSGGGPERLRLLRRATDLRSKVAHDRYTHLDLLWLLKSAAQSSASHRAELDTVAELLLELDPAVAPAECAELLVRTMHLRFSLGLGFLTRADSDEAERVGRNAPDSWQYALTVAEQAHAAMWEGDSDSAELADRALALAERAGHPQALSYAHTARAVALVAVDQAQARVEAALGRTLALQAGDFWAYCHAVLWEGNALDIWSAPATVDLVAARRLEAVAAGAPHPYVAWLASVEAAGRLAAGRWEECTALLRICLGSEPGPLVEAVARLVAARLAVLQGRVDEGLAHLARVPEIFTDPSGFRALEYDPVRAEAMLAAGDPDGAVECIQAALDNPGVAPTMCEWLLPLAAQALADQSQHARDRFQDDAPVQARLDLLVQRFPVVVRDFGIPASDDDDAFAWGSVSPFYRRQVEAFDAWYHAEVGRSRGSADNTQQWERASELLVETGLPWEAAYAGWRAAEAHLRGPQPDRGRAARWARSSSDAALRLGAEPVLTRVRDLARAARIRLDPVDAAGVAPEVDHLGLTRREREVLGHVVAGRTYAEIAAELVLSEKTVSTHISHMLRKTGATNRVELAALAARAGASP